MLRASGASICSNVNGKLTAEQVRTRFAGHIVKRNTFIPKPRNLRCRPCVREFALLTRLAYG